MATGTVNIGPTLVVDTAVSDNVSVTASGGISSTFSCAKTGYTAIGVVGFSVTNATSSGSGASAANLRACYLSAANSVTFYGLNSTATAIKIKLTAYVLYRKNS